MSTSVEYNHKRSPEFPVRCQTCFALVDYADQERHAQWHEDQK